MADTAPGIEACAIAVHKFLSGLGVPVVRRRCEAEMSARRDMMRQSKEPLAPILPPPSGRDPTLGEKFVALCALRDVAVKGSPGAAPSEFGLACWYEAIKRRVTELTAADAAVLDGWLRELISDFGRSKRAGPQTRGGDTKRKSVQVNGECRAEEAAITLLAISPSMSLAEIAKQVGKSRKWLYQQSKFLDLAEKLGVYHPRVCANGAIPKGSVNGFVDAVDHRGVDG